MGSHDYCEYQRRRSVQADTEVWLCAVAHAPNQLAVGKEQLAKGSWQKAIGKRQLAKGNLQRAVGKMKFIKNKKFSIETNATINYSTNQPTPTTPASPSTPNIY
jgi:hypothetical protein